MEKNIFEKIRDGEEPADIVFKNEYVTAFRDIYPDTPIHILIIPNKTIRSLDDIEEEDGIYMSNIMLSAKKIAKEQGLNNGYRLITNCGKNGHQVVPYLHFHLVGGEGEFPLGKMITLPKTSKQKFKLKFEQNSL